ncbi:hypothetical protein N0V82_010603 [Gnomoniopsis sp. IMI 355080]|nr:hypothetical protein N0V82_010603 [Gnomoniopsis sp. IMI 355080]
MEHPPSDSSTNGTPFKLNTLQPPARTANSTPISSPGLFSPANPRATMSLPSSQPASENTTPAVQHSPFLHPLQTHKVRETHVANVDRDYTTGRKIINHYEVIEEIGRGVHGKVKLARDLDNGQNVAIKIVPRFSKKRRLGRITQNVSPFEKTKREIAILKKIRHPNVVALLEVIDDPDYKKIYLCLEHVECGEVIWRKKGLPAICAYERQRIEREMRGEPMSEEEEQYLKTIENRYNIKELKRAHMAEKLGTQGEGEPWSLEFGAEGRTGSQSETDGADVGVGSYQSHSPFGHMSAPNSQAPSRTQSMKSMSGVTLESSPPPPPDVEDETPGRLHDTITSISALEGTMWGAYDDNQFRQRSPSMADSIISHMSSLDFNAHSHDPYADDYSYVPCFTIDEARRAFRDVVLGLQYLHYQGIVHRDIKPANLLWTKEHSVKISDFGVSYFGRPMREFEPDDTVSESEAQDFDDELELSKTVGTPAFFAPELCYTDLDSGPPPKITEKIDIWSLGVTLYCMIFARIPFLAEDEFRMFRKIATEKVYIPNRRLRPVDPSTSPKTPSLYIRQNEAPFRDDQALVYEDVDENLRDLLDKMLTKDPRKRIDLRGVKQHPWILADMPNQIGWIDDTDPFRQTEGRKIQLTDKDLHDAVVPLTLLERARSTIKKIHSKFSGGRSSDRTNDTTIGARRRATSSAASSTGDIPASAIVPAIPIIPHLREFRRKSIRADGDYFANVRDHSHAQSDHPLTYSVVASPDETPSVTNDSTSKNPVAVGDSISGQTLEVNTDFNGNEEVAERQTPTAPQHQFTRHRHRHSQSVSYATIALHDNVLESQTAPTTPTLLSAYSPSRSSRKGRDPFASPDDSVRAQSVDRALVFHSQDKRAEAKVALSTFAAPGNFEQPKKVQQMRSMDLRRAVGDSPMPSPLLFSPQAISQYQYGQHKSDVALDKFQTVINDHQPQHKSETTLDKFQTVVKIEDRPVTAHRVKDLESKTPPPRTYGPSTSTDESFNRAKEAQRRREKLEYEEQQHQQDLRPAAEIEKAAVSCPPSPDDEECPHANGMSRAPTFGSSRLSSKSSSADAIAMPSVSSSAVTSPVSYTTSASHKDLADAVTFQSDPSLPALLSGASSVSADPEGDFLHVPGSVSRGSVLESTESLTPPALGKEPVAGFPLEDASLDDPDSVRVDPTPIDSEDCGDDEDSDSEEEGLVMMSRRPKKSGSIKESPKASLRSRRRGTNASVGSTDTAKKVSSEE